MLVKRGSSSRYIFDGKALGTMISSTDRPLPPCLHSATRRLNRKAQKLSKMQRVPPMHDQNSCTCPSCPQNANRPMTLSYRTSFRVSSQPKHHEQHCERCELWDRFRADTVRWPVDKKEPLALFALLMKIRRNFAAQRHPIT
jgi:hypothetical protein